MKQILYFFLISILCRFIDIAATYQNRKLYKKINIIQQLEVMLAKLQQINNNINDARSYSYLCKYEAAQKIFKRVIETIRQQMILNNNFNRREVQTWKVLQQTVREQKNIVDGLVNAIAGFSSNNSFSEFKEKETERNSTIFQTQQRRTTSNMKNAKPQFSVSKSHNRIRDLDVWETPKDKKPVNAVKKVGKNISQAPPPFPKARTIQSGGAKRKTGAGTAQKKSFINHVYSDGNGPDKNLIEMLEREVMDRSPKVSFDDIADLQTAKGLLQEAVLLPLKMPQFFTGIRRAWKGVLMFGPPGTGKTLLAKAVASSGGTTFFNVSASSLASKWKGQSQKLVRILFEMAKFYAPSVIFFDEIDALGSKRKDGQDESNRKVKTELLVQMDGATSSENDQNKFVIVLAATNRPWDLDEALRRRLEKRIYIPLPTSEGRRELVRINLKNVKMDEGLDLNFVVNKTEGFSGADITNVCRQAAYMPMRRKLKQAGGIKNIGNIKKFEEQVNVPLTRQDFLQALKNVNKSVGREDIRKYEHWMQQFGTV